MSHSVFGLFLLAQSSLIDVSGSQQALAVADQKLDSCLQTRAKLWSTLADDASSIADGTLYICRQFIDERELQTRKVALALIMSRGLSTAGLDATLLEQNREAYLRLRAGAIAVVLNQRYNSAHPR